jgi:hypothetical protein
MKNGNGNGVSSIFAELRRINAEIATLEKEKAIYKAKLAKLIEPGKSKAGVKHVVRQWTSTNWKNVYTGLINKKLIPQTKMLAVNEVILENSKASESHTFTEEN